MAPPGQSALPPLPVVRLDGGAVPAGPHTSPPQTQGVPQFLPVSALDDPSRVALDGAPSVSISISRPMPLADMLRLLVAGTPLSLVLDDAVTGSFVGDLRGLTMRQALEAVLFPGALDYDVRGNLLRVYPRQPKTQLFDVNYVNVRRSAQRGIHGTMAIPRSTAGANGESSMEASPLDALEKGVGALLSTSGRMHLDRSAGIVQVTDFADRLDQVGSYLDAVHLRASRQVRIEARVFEVTLSDASATGIDWRRAAASAGSAVRQDPGAAGLSVRDFNALLQALGEQGSVRMISAPHVLAMNNEPAVITAGTQDVYFMPASHASSDGGEQAFVPATVLQGLSLIVTPQVAGDGIVQLHVAPSYAQKTGQAKSPRAGMVPVMSVTEADTNVRVRDGETAVISGLLRQQTRSIPGTGVSGLFGAQSHETVMSELVILLTPTVVVPGIAAAGVR
jgi:MSHA biogenesis protein MshL